jgi:hypothetical protein
MWEVTYQPRDEWTEIAKTPAPVAPGGAPLSPGNIRLLSTLVGAAILLGSFRRIFIGGDLPIWFDELFSAAIASHPDFHTFITRCLHELSGPVYYGTLWLWVKLAGNSDVALRFPSLVCAVAAPLVILRWGHPDRQVRMIWAAIIALLLPITYHANEARPYSLLILLTVGQTIALNRMLRRPSEARAWWWSCLSALLILTHYYTVVITGLQGLAILSRGRKAFYWRALLPFVPVAAWMSVHFATILAFTAPGVAFYTRLPFSCLSVIPEALVGTAPFGITLIAIIAGTTLWSFRAPELRAIRSTYLKWDVATAATGAGAVIIVTVAAMVHPCFSPRYLIPYLPSLMLGVALWAKAWSQRIPACGAATVTVFLLLGGRETANHAIQIAPDPSASFNFAAASRYIGTAHPRRLIFLWDCVSASAAGGPLFNEVAGFELARAGQPVPVKTLSLGGTDAEPNRALLTEASRPGDAILWTYNISIQGTLGIRHPAAISRIDPRWTCRDFGKKPIAVIACIRHAYTANP